MNLDSHPELRAAVEEATLVLKNRLEVDDSKHRFHSELGVFKDELRIIKGRYSACLETVRPFFRCSSVLFRSGPVCSVCYPLATQFIRT
jgi:hypothetical protein